ncbi:hypothetical protein [Muriicola sp. Z0-33]|uniref:hypothetical protein n=1 Tax=Muriicola sp. Z0-33 TaxID=2816957 RepID=UPI0022371A5A|nr:hypothetical protein [Muriicola sp. Z0-33]MCW5516508.1 hypothetical protein [Muriicola sp. Z0-33]
MQNLPAYHFIAPIVSFLGQLTVLIACIMLLIKQRSIAAGLMTAGMILSVIFTVFGFLVNIISANKSAEALIKNQGIISTLNSLSYLLFGIGLLFLALNWSATRK